jgi:DNA (cytosine-5)-methyltransferase 1
MLTNTTECDVHVSNRFIVRTFWLTCHMEKLLGVSLFASSGIGDLAMRELGVQMIVANEFVPERAALFEVNYPDCEVLAGDIWAMSEEIVKHTIKQLEGRPLDVLVATPPCQGMSSNGLGKLLAEVRAGNRPALDPRNRLIIPTIEIIKQLKPRLVVFENVPAMRNTVIMDEAGDLVNILDFIARELQPDYSGAAHVVEFADYGVPQRRQRLIATYTSDKKLKREIAANGIILSAPTHSATGNLIQPSWRTVRDAIGNFPALDAATGFASNTSFHPLHRVPVLDQKKYEWIRHTPEGSGAFDNQCVNAACGYDGNLVHGSTRSVEGINRANRDTPLYCERCHELLPRPYTIVDGEKRLMRGFTSAYKRMNWDSPAPTLTTNLSYPSSDHNIHPSQNRVLSLQEALTLHTISDYEYLWQQSDGRPVSDSLIRDSIGESVPPAGLEVALRDTIQSLFSQKPVSESLVA